MNGPPLVGWLLVVISTATGISCLLRVRPSAGCATTSGERHSARAEGLMGIGMGLMAVPASVLDQRLWGPVLFTVVFGVTAVRSLPLVRRAPHHAHHVVCAVAMVYMAVAMAGSGEAKGTAGMEGMPGMMGYPLITGVLLGYFAAYALWAGTRIPAAAAAGQPGGGVWQAPELAAACRVSLGLGMVAMLLTL
jgi:hypothetical protein